MKVRAQLSLVRAAIVALALLAPLSACKQGEGGFCQIKEDCEEGLECNAGTMRCQRPGANVADAAPAADAAIIDASVPDAAPAYDAGLDAGIDAGDML